MNADHDSMCTAGLRSLNLSFSLLPSLDEVDKIAAALPKLDALQLKCATHPRPNSA